MPHIKIYRQHAKGAKNIKDQAVKDLKVTMHEEYDKWGKLRANKYVEFVVIGNHRTWPDFMAISDFKKLNPGIKV